MIALPIQLIENYTSHATFYDALVSSDSYWRGDIKNYSLERVLEYADFYREFEAKYPEGDIVRYSVESEIKKYILDKCDVDFIRKVDLFYQEEAEEIYRTFQLTYESIRGERHNRLKDKTISDTESVNLDKEYKRRLWVLEATMKKDILRTNYLANPLMVDLTPEDITYLMMMS